jgi:CHAT domain-containing protein
VPFAVLTDRQGVPLLERFELCFDYSATGARAVLTKPRRPDQATGAILALADPDFGGASRFSGATRIQSEPQVEGQRPISVPDRPISVPDRTLLLPRGTVLRSLPGTEREAAAIRRDFPSAATLDVLVLTHQAAQESTFKREAGKYRYLHLATHGFFNDAAPLLSSLVLAMPPATGDGSEEDGFLTAREIFDLDLSHCELAVLSACDTARGERRSGEGVIGLTWALFVAGCPSQVLSQWPVNDASTATLMERFYANLSHQGKGMSKGSALRAAALSLRQSPSNAHPYYWAPFLLVGDWR